METLIKIECCIVVITAAPLLLIISICAWGFFFSIIKQAWKSAQLKAGESNVTF